jgi:hypothetical protein
MTTTPNPVLLEVFGTDDFWRRNLEKTAAPPFPMQAAAPLAYMGMMAHSQHTEMKQLLEAQVLTQLFRQAEQGRMAPVQAGLRGQAHSLSDMGSAVQQLRPMAAYEAMMGLKYGSVAAMRHTMEKEAGIGQALGGAMGGLGRAFGATGRRLAGTTAQRATGMASPLSGVGMRMRQAGVQMQQRGQQWSRFGTGATGRFQQAAARQGVLPSPRPPAAAARAAAPLPVSGASSKTIWPGIRNKALLYGGGAAALGGTGYAGYKGLQTAKDYMMQPTYASSSWGPSGMMPASGVNEFGYQDVSY